MSFTVQFGKTTKARNSTLVPALGNSCQVLLKDNTSIIRPSWRIHTGASGAPAMSALFEMNYCYCAEFKRYYYIVNITLETSVIAVVECEVDVLATFKNEILATDAFVTYSESTYNAGIPDKRLAITGGSQCYNNQYPVPICNESGTFCLTCATPNNDGKTGPSATVVMSESNLSSLANKLYATDWWESIKDDEYHPEEALLACMWTPLNSGNVANGSYQAITVGSHDLGGGISAKQTVEQYIGVSFNLPIVNDPDHVGVVKDFRNFEPYAEYYLWLPGVGLVQVPMVKLYGSEPIFDHFPFVIYMSASPVTGDVIYQVHRPTHTGSGIAGEPPIQIYKGNFGVEIPISRTVGRFGNISQSLGTTVLGLGSVLLGAAIDNPVLMFQGAAGAAGGIGGMVSAMQGGAVSTTTSGSIGGWSVPSKFNMMIEAITIVWDLSDSPSNVKSTIGRPLYANKKLGGLHGYVQCAGAHVKAWGTEEEMKMLSSYVNSASGYGGIIIE